MMRERDVASASTTGGLPVAPTLGPALASAHVPRRAALVDGRVVLISLVAILVAAGAGVIARVLTDIIGLVTNLAFYGRVSPAFVSPAGNTLGAWVIAIPVVGGVIVGCMARYGSEGIRGHGIP